MYYYRQKQYKGYWIKEIQCTSGAALQKTQTNPTKKVIPVDKGNTMPQCLLLVPLTALY